MQADNGLFYNFVINSSLDINRTHHRSVADQVDWWTCRAVWALCVGARAMRNLRPDLSDGYLASARRVFPHLRDLLCRYPRTETFAGHDVPTWLVHGSAADATSELLLGLAALHEIAPSDETTEMLARFAEGIAAMRRGSMNTFPYGLHSSWRKGWHAWGNAQTQALAESGWTRAAAKEAESFYPRLLINGFVHSIDLGHPPIVVGFERIAYGVRCVSLGLVRLFEKTGEERFAKLAGLAASWLMGNNAVGEAMYDRHSGRCFDGIDSKDLINRNAGGESTIEALYTILEVEQHAEALRWLHAVGGAPARTSIVSTGDELQYRLFRSGAEPSADTLAVVMNLTRETLVVAEGDEEIGKWIRDRVE